MLSHTVKLLNSLKINNNTIWMHQHKDEFDEAKNEFNEFVSNLIPQLHKLDSNLGILGIKDCVYRLNRDIRFSKDKNPYKTWLAASFSAGGKNLNTPTYYFHLSSENQATVGGGSYSPSSEQIKLWREKISEDSKPIRKILSNSNFKKYFEELKGETLVKPPRGYDVNDPNLDLLKHKNILASTQFGLDNIDYNALDGILMEHFTTLHPLISYLRQIGL